MKILCERKSSEMLGWKNSLEKIGFDFIFWEPNVKPIFDAFDEIEPDIFIGDVRTISRGTATCLGDYPETRAIFYSPKFDDVLEEDKEYMEQLRNETNQPELIFSFCYEHCLDDTLGGWSKLGYKTLSLMKAADTFRFVKTQRDPLWSSDICFIGDYKPYLEDFILPICHKDFRKLLPGKLKVRLFGDRWPVVQGIGCPEDSNIPKILSSSFMVIDISNNTYEPSEIPFSVGATGGLCLSNNFHNLFPESPSFSTPQELQKLIRHHYSNRSADNLKHQINAWTMSKNTYDHRMLSLLKTLELYNEAEELGGFNYL